MKKVILILLAVLYVVLPLNAQQKNDSLQSWIKLDLKLIEQDGIPSHFVMSLVNRMDYKIVIIAGQNCLNSEVAQKDGNVMRFENQLLLDESAGRTDPLPERILIAPHSTYEVTLPLVLSNYELIVNKGVLPVVRSSLELVEKARIYLKDLDVSLTKIPLEAKNMTLYSNWVSVDGMTIVKEME